MENRNGFYACTAGNAEAKIGIHSHERRCPEDFRCAVRQWKDTCEKMLEESRAVPEGRRMDMGEYVSLLVERCRAAEAMRPAMDWMVRKTGVLPLKVESAADKRETLKHFKEKLASGEGVILRKYCRRERNGGRTRAWH